VPDFAAGLLAASQLSSKPLAGKRIGVVRQAMGEGVETGVHDAVTAAVTHLEALGADVEEVRGRGVWGQGRGGG
jgi:aspartyl-tRNA(Asn)/glutamyl-tRNA(Gln) amidotransferase subunit A